MNRQIITITATFLFLFLSSFPVFADIYQYTDANGNLVFTNDPTQIPKNKKINIRKEIKSKPEEMTRKLDSKPCNILKATPAPAPAPSPSYSDNTIIVQRVPRNRTQMAASPSRPAPSSTCKPNVVYSPPPSNLTLHDRDILHALRRLGEFDDRDYKNIRHEDVQQMEMMLKIAMGVDDITTWYPDPRYSSPEATWRIHKAALRNGDIESAVKCFMPINQNKERELYNVIGTLGCRRMAEQMRPLEKISDNEDGAKYRIARNEIIDGKEMEITYYVTFNNLFGEWRIEEY